MSTRLLGLFSFIFAGIWAVLPINYRFWWSGLGALIFLSWLLYLHLSGPRKILKKVGPRSSLKKINELMGDIKHFSYHLHSECGAAVYLIQDPMWDWRVRIDWCDKHAVQTKGETPEEALNKMIDMIKEKMS